MWFSSFLKAPAFFGIIPISIDILGLAFLSTIDWLMQHVTL